jgi:hypothetical protein
MKKVVLLLAVFLTGFSYISKAQLILPNGNFEDWSLYHPVTHPPFYEPDGGFFKTMNILDTIPTPPGITVYRCDTAHSGTYSVRCITRKIDILSILIPGVVGNIGLHFATSSAILGLPYKWTTKPERFQGYYQAYPLNNDSTGVLILLSKWNTSTKKRDTIAYNRLVFHGTVSEWTKFDTAIVYRNTTEMPDSVCILLLSCAGYNASNMFGSVGQVGSQALFDDVTLTGVYPWGVENLLKQDVSLFISPNPASDHISVTLDKAVKNGILEVFNTQGQRVSFFKMEDISGRFNVGQLSVGMYYYRFGDSKQTMASGSFIISR